MALEKDKHVSVTHFINPQLFWFHEINVPNPAYHEIKELEDQLEQYYQTHQTWTQAIRKPEVDMLVAVKFLSWHKMIRARVEHIGNFSKNTQGGEFIMWAIDYGFPFQTKSDQIYRLPDKLSRTVRHIRRGGLAYLSPAEKDFDFRMNCAVTSVKENWSQRACELMDKLLNESESVVFVEKFECEQHVWGDLIVTTHLGYKCNVRDYLIGLSLAVAAGPDFRESCLNLKVTKILPWMTNSGNSKFSANKGFLCEGKVRDDKKLQQAAGTELDDYAKKKVEDWCTRNELANLQESAHFEEDILLDSVKFDDSVSNKDFEVRDLNDIDTVELTKKNSSGGDVEMNRAVETCARLLSDEESLNSIGNCEISEQKLGMAGALTKSLEKKYGKKQLPPIPKTIDFDVSADSEKELYKENVVPHEKEKLLSGVESLVSVRSGVSRKQKLLEKRKQISNKQSNESITINNRQEMTLKPENSKPSNKLIELKSNTSTTVESDIESSLQHTNIGNSENSSLNVSVVSANVTNSRVKRHLLNRQRASMKPEEITTDSTSTNEPTTQTTTASTKRMEYLRKQRLEKLKAQKNENTKPEKPAEEPISTALEQALANKVVERDAVPTATAKPSAHIGRLLSLRKKHSEAQKQKKVINRAFLLDKEVKDEKPDSDYELSNSRLRPAAETLKESNTFHGLRMIPAGFDITNLSHYKDEKNHWHRKATTRFDHVPHDADIAAMETIEHHASAGPKTKAVESPANTTKHASILDTSVPEISEDPIDLRLSAEPKSKEPTSPEELSPYSSSNSPAPKKYGRYRSLKSPAQQMNKIDEILRSAYDEKAGGNNDILDLENLNSSGCKDDSDTTELYSADDGTNICTTTDNEDIDFDLNSTSNKRSLIRNRLLKKQTAQQEHLKQIEDKLTIELNTPKPETFRIHLPEVKELRIVDGEHKLKTKFIDHLVLAHSNVPLTALTCITEAFFLKEIHNEMENMRVTKLYRIQAYAWPHLLRGNSMFVVNPHKTGKTWSYLPAICSLVAYRIQSGRLVDTYGPVAIILQPTSAHVEVVQSYCKRLLLGVRPTVTTVASYGVRNAIEAKIQLLNSCGILVATPASLLRLLRDNEQESLIDMERLKHLVIDDLDLMLSRSQEHIELLLKSLFKLSKPCKGAAQAAPAWQLVVTSRDWDSLFVALMRKSNQPLLLIGDFLEAAVYGRVMISIKLCPSERKIDTILEFIEQYSLENERVLVLCNSDDDVYEVVDALTTSAFVCIAYDSHASADVRIIIEEWRKKKVMSSRILVCADSSFPELQIQNVSHVIHYSMPTSWTKFTARFAALAQTYENYVSTNFRMPTGIDRPTARSLILLDEENSMQLPRLMDFMKKHDQLKFIHPDILAVSKRVLVEREEARILQGARMCPYVLEFGECDEPRCEFRHNLTRFDAIAKKDKIPTHGDMRILVLKVFSPTHYAARLLQHRSANASKWQDIRCSKEVCNFSMQLNMHYLKQENWTIHWPLHIGDLCVYKYLDTYQRARILELPDVPNTAYIRAVKLTLKLIDEGSIITSVKSDELYVCDAKFSDFPAQAINIRLTGVVPFDNERTWDTKSTKTVQKWIMTDIKKNECVHVSINFTLIDTIWVNNVIVMEQLAQVGQYVYRVNLKRSLMEKNIADVGDSKRPSIREIAEELGLLAYDDEADMPLTDSDGEFKSFSENDMSNLIKFSSNDDTADSDKLQQVESQTSMQEVEQSNRPNNNGDSNAVDEEDWDAQLHDNANNANEIYLPLQTTINIEADVTTTITTNQESVDENLISTDILTPTTTKEAWLELPLEQMVKVEIGNEDENGNWSDIYLQNIDSAQLDKFDELLELINKHIVKLKHKPAMPFPASWFKPMQNCIIHYDERYLRAKLYGIFNNSASTNAATSTIYRFFLCDYACFVMAKPDELYKDFLYPTTKEIVEFTPYQAVHCRLAGINFNKFAKRFKVSKDYLYAYAIKACGCGLSAAIPDFNINSYEILLYESETEENLQTIELFNTKLIDSGAATVNESEKDIFQKHTPVPKAPTGLCNFDELLNCIQRSFELEMCELDSTATKTTLQAIASPKPQETLSVEQFPKCTNKPLGNYKPLKSKFTPNSSGGEEEPLLSSTKTSSTSDTIDTLQSTSNALDTTASSTNTLPPPPALQAKHKRPQVTWYDTDCFIYLVIHAPDIDDYYLEVTTDTLIFSANIQDVPHALVLNFIGLVEPSLVSHEIRGLNVVVRLVKGVFMKWPRLLQQTLRFPWLTYNLNAIDLAEVEQLLPQQQLDMVLQNTAALNQLNSYSSDEDSDDERNLFQTYTPIVNTEDLYDPTVDII